MGFSLIRFVLAAAALAAILSACSAPQVAQVQTDVAKVTTALNTACADVQAAEGVVGIAGALPAINNLEAYANSACTVAGATSEIVTKAVNDPTTIAWVQNLATQIKAAIPAKS